MTAAQSFSGISETPEYVEYKAYDMQKLLQYKKANYAYLKFKKSIKIRYSIIDNVD